MGTTVKEAIKYFRFWYIHIPTGPVSLVLDRSVWYWFSTVCVQRGAAVRMTADTHACKRRRGRCRDESISWNRDRHFSWHRNGSLIFNFTQATTMCCSRARLSLRTSLAHSWNKVGNSNQMQEWKVCHLSFFKLTLTRNEFGSIVSAVCLSRLLGSSLTEIQFGVFNLLNCG